MSTTKTIATGPPLDQTALRAALVRPGGLWHDLSVVAETGSTNKDLLAAARGGAPEGVVLADEVAVPGRDTAPERHAYGAAAGSAFLALPLPSRCCCARWRPRPPAAAGCRC